MTAVRYVLLVCDDCGDMTHDSVSASAPEARHDAAADAWLSLTHPVRDLCPRCAEVHRAAPNPADRCGDRYGDSGGGCRKPVGHDGQHQGYGVSWGVTR